MKKIKKERKAKKRESMRKKKNKIMMKDDIRYLNGLKPER